MNLSNIERINRNVELNETELLALVLKAFPDCEGLDDWKILAGGALNTTYKFQIKGKSFVLRIYSRSKEHCKMERAIHQLIHQSVSIPKLIYADEGNELFTYSIFEFIPGVHIYELSNQEKNHLSYELGCVLASIHAFKFSQAGFFEDGMVIKNSFALGSSPYFEETHFLLINSQNVRNRLGEELTDEVLAFIEKNKKFFPKVKSDNICLTHSDFKPVNLLYTSDRKVVVLDWEFAHAGIGILDFGILLRHRHEFPLDLNTLENSYKQFGGILPSNWFRSALIADFMNMITLINAAAERPHLFQQLKKAIQSTMAHWELASEQKSNF